MRSALTVLLLLLAAAPAAEPPAPRTTPLLNVEVVDREGVTTRLSGFHRVSADHRFRGFLGEAVIEISYERIREIAVRAPALPGGRPRADVTLRTGSIVPAEFDEREGDQLMLGFAAFGRVEIFFRDLRRLRFLGRTSRRDLPVYGRPGAGVDVRVRDRLGVSTELVRFGRTTGDQAVPGIRGASRILVPLRMIRRLRLRAVEGVAGLEAEADLRRVDRLRFRIPVNEEEALFRGEAPFGSFYIRLGKVRELVVHRVSPPLRGLAPPDTARAPAYGGERPPEDAPTR